MTERARVCKTATEPKAVRVFSASDSRAYKLSASPLPATKNKHLIDPNIQIMVSADGGVVSKGHIRNI